METAIGNVKHDYVEPVDEYMTVYLCFNRLFIFRWPLLYGSPLMGATSALSATIINDYFRRKCRLPKMGMFMVGMPIVLVSAVSMTIAHHTVFESQEQSVSNSLRKYVTFRLSLQTL